MAALNPPAGRLRVLAWPADRNRTGNPYNAILTGGLRGLGVAVDEFSASRLARGGYDVFHAHWPDGALSRGGAARGAAGAGVLLALTAAARLRGTRVAWTVHNLRSHAQVSPVLERAFWTRWTSLVDGSIHLGETARAAAMGAFPQLEKKPSFVIPHPHYRDSYPPAPRRIAARVTLGLPPDSRVIVFAGHVRRYKGAVQLAGAFRGIKDQAARLVVAGRPESSDLADELRRAAGDDARILLRLDHVADDEMPSVIGCADLVVLPYAELLNSGVALLALSLDRPVLAPAAGAMPDLQEMTGPAWVRLYDGALTSDALAEELRDASESPPTPPAPLDAFDPTVVARATVDAYRALVAVRPRG